MQKFGSILVITLLLIAYGRCVADQYGMLHTTDASCCQTICTADTHHAEEADSSCTDTHDHQQKEHNNEETPAPCQLCVILDNDSIQIEAGVKIPCPIISDLKPVFEFSSEMASLLSRLQGQFRTNDLITDLPDPPTELNSLFRCLVAKTTPVRGPSIA